MTSEQYWNKRRSYYPFQVVVDHMSDQDVNPARFATMTRKDFLRVPFDGKAHWGFKDAESLRFFKSVAGV